MKRPHMQDARPRSQSMNAAPTLPTLETTEEGVEKMPVPMMRPILWKAMSVRTQALIER